MPKSTILERQNVKLELIDTPGSSDSNNNDEQNLKILTQYLRSKGEIHQILLVLSIENVLSHDTRNYLKILSWIFTPIQFMSNLIVIFTHFPKDPDQDDINRLNNCKRGIYLELQKIFELPDEFKRNNPEIPVYVFNTKIFNKNISPCFEQNSLNASNNLIEEIKFRTSLNFYRAINTTNLECDKEKILQKIEQEKNGLLQKIQELRNYEEKRKRAEKDAEDERRRYEDFLSNMQISQTIYRANLNNSSNNLALFGIIAIVVSLLLL